MKELYYKKAVVLTLFFLFIGTLLIPSIIGTTKTIPNPEPINADDWWTLYRHDAANTGCSSAEAPNTNQLCWYYDTNDDIEMTSALIVDNNVIVATGGFYDFDILKNLTTPPITNFEESELINYMKNKIENINTEYYGSIICLDAETGAVIWRQQLTLPNDPAVHDNKIYVTSMDIYSYNSYVNCLDLNSGNIIWQKTCAGWSLSPTIVYENKIYFGTIDLFSYYYNGGYHCLDATTGDQIWSKNFGPFEWPIYSPAAAAEGKVLVAPLDLFYYTSTLYCIDAISGNYIWTKPIGFPAYASPVLAEGRVFMSFMDIYSYIGSLNCYDITTGGFIWAYTIPNFYPTSGSAMDENNLFLPGVEYYSGTPKIYCISCVDGSLIWETEYNDQPEDTWFSVPAIADGKVYVTADYSADLICVNADDGSQLWKYTLNHDTRCPVSIADERIFTADYYGRIYAFEDFLKIKEISGGLFSIKADIVNEGALDIPNVNWTMTIQGGILGFINKTVNGTIMTLSGDSSLRVQSSPLFGIGRINITVTLQTNEISPFSKKTTGFILGPLIFVK